MTVAGVFPKAVSLQIALNYAEDWAIFPCKPHTKIPATEHGFKDASQDGAQIRTWYSAGGANIALACGASGLGVLDFDVPKADYTGAELLDLLLEQYPTVTADTPSKGVHLLYRQRPGLVLTNKAGDLPKGVDVRGDGGYILVAPSDVTYTGKEASDRGLSDGFNGAYAWRPGLGPHEIDTAVIPAFLVDLIMGGGTRSPKPARNGGPPQDDVIAEFNRTHDIVELLTPHGYTLLRDGRDYARLARPDRDVSSVVVFKTGDPERSYHHSTSDPLHTDDHARDAFDVWVQLEHGGDTKKAFEAAKRAQGKWTDTRQNATPPAAGQAAPSSNGASPAPAPSHNGQLSEAQNGTSPDLAAIDKGKHDLGNAVYAHGLYGSNYLFSTGRGWLYWTGTHWDDETAESKVAVAMTRALKQRLGAALATDDTDLMRATVPSAKHTRDALYHFRNMVTVSSGEFDHEPHLLNCKNGVIDLRSGELAAHEPSNRFTYCVPTDYTPGERSDLWDRLLLDWFAADHDLVLYLQRAMGYSVTGETKEECLFYVRGPGRAGKGTLVNTVASTLGYELAKGIQFDAFTMVGDSQNFRLAPLHNARFVSASESKKGERLDEALIKQLTGRDPITAAFKYQTPFTFTPTFKVWLMSNYPPKGDVDDDAFWYRVRLLELTKPHMGTEDNSIKDALLRPENRQGVLAWLVFGSMRWYETSLGTPQKVWDAGEAAREEQDNVLQWIKDCCSVGDQLWVSMDELYRSYESWCKDTGIRMPLAKNTLCTRLKSKGYDNQRTRVDLRAITKVFGLMLKE
jgi:putative DNA primase/helicase